MHSYEICLVGYKDKTSATNENILAATASVVDKLRKIPLSGASSTCLLNVSNNVLFAEVRKKSQKPDEMYEIIDMLMPGGKKIELFARNNNIRPGWVR